MGRGGQQAVGGAEALFSSRQRRGVARAFADACPHCVDGRDKQGFPCSGIAHGRRALRRDDESLLIALRVACARKSVRKDYSLPDAWAVGWRMQAQLRRLPPHYADAAGSVNAQAISQRMRKLAELGWVEIDRGGDRLRFRLSERGERALQGAR